MYEKSKTDYIYFGHDNQFFYGLAILCLCEYKIFVTFYL